ncbi:hypothetical protein ACGFIW_04020 [Micromonospora sp. NPDC048935]|uniref:hypothetical protein n=1 Tax=Micromonospora sp. NPDC048935 TaxID=3364262 RepID=UPI00372138A8
MADIAQVRRPYPRLVAAAILVVPGAAAANLARSATAAPATGTARGAAPELSAVRTLRADVLPTLSGTPESYRLAVRGTELAVQGGDVAGVAAGMYRLADRIRSGAEALLAADAGRVAGAGLARPKGHLGQGLISFQSPSEKTSTVPSTTVMAVLSSMAQVGTGTPDAHAYGAGSSTTTGIWRVVFRS